MFTEGELPTSTEGRDQRIHQLLLKMSHQILLKVEIQRITPTFTEGRERKHQLLLKLIYQLPLKVEIPNITPTFTEGELPTSTEGRKNRENTNFY